MDHRNDVSLDAERMANTTSHDTERECVDRLAARGQRLAVNREESIMPVSSKDRPSSTPHRSISLSEIERRVAALVRPFSLPLLRVSLVRQPHFVTFTEQRPPPEQRRQHNVTL